MTDTMGTMVDAVGRARHSLLAMHRPETASVTVHGTCPIAGCRTMNVIDVHADTRSFTCSGCGTTFDA
jgi:hypothetical protein